MEKALFKKMFSTVVFTMNEMMSRKRGTMKSTHVVIYSTVMKMFKETVI